MATMTITITVNAKGVKWSRTASIEVDAAQYQQGNSRNSALFPPEGTASSMGIHSFAGMAVALFANKSKGAVHELYFYTGSTMTSGVSLSTYHPFVLYAGVGTGFSGAINGSATDTDTPTLDADYALLGAFTGAQTSQALVGLKPIS